MKTILFSFLTLLLFVFNGYSGTVDTLKTYSPEMNKEVYSLVVLPDDYETEAAKSYPVLYLLHGHSGNYKDWLSLAPALQDYVDEFQMIVVTPDGGYDSWYLDSPVDESVRYETFMTKTLIGAIDGKYRTLSDRIHRGISGLSMGGHGALYLSIRHPDLYGTATSMSGGVDLRPFPDNWNLKGLLGSIERHTENWEKNSVVNLLEQVENKQFHFFIDIGVDDFFLEVNRNLHEALLDRGIDHDYIERPGGHTWEYWRNALPYHMLFFSRTFLSEEDKTEP